MMPLKWHVRWEEGKNRLEKELLLERYRLVTENQRYVTNMAKETFHFYSRAFVGFTTGMITLISIRAKLSLSNDTVKHLALGLLVLVGAIGAASIIQIFICIRRWREFRNAEGQINPACPAPPRSWWVFETAYILGIVLYMFIFWRGYVNLPKVLLLPEAKGPIRDVTTYVPFFCPPSTAEPNEIE